jgi:hypothetical protein
MTKRQADLLMRLTDLAATISIEAERARRDLDDMVMQAHLRAALVSVEAACSLVRKAGA